MKGHWASKFKRASATDCTSPDGIAHASAAQMRRWIVLRLWQSQGIIRNLRREVNYPLVIDDRRSIKTRSGKRVRCYRADHVYEREAVRGNNDWREIIEDVKGFLTDASELKIRAFEAIYETNVLIVR